MDWAELEGTHFGVSFETAVGWQLGLKSSEGWPRWDGKDNTLTFLALDVSCWLGAQPEMLTTTPICDSSLMVVSA